jgi:hypothetical protein
MRPLRLLTRLRVANSGRVNDALIADGISLT